MSNVIIQKIIPQNLAKPHDNPYDIRQRDIQNVKTTKNRSDEGCKRQSCKGDVDEGESVSCEVWEGGLVYLYISFLDTEAGRTEEG
jgi:hypothetical protein